MDDSSVDLLKSNADDVAKRLIYENIDIDGSGLVKLMGFLLSRAEQIKALHEQGTRIDQRLLSGDLRNEAEFRGELQDVLYEPLCLKWLLSRMCKALSERLECEVSESQEKIRRVLHIVYTDEGGVDSYKLDSTDPPEQPE